MTEQGQDSLYLAQLKESSLKVSTSVPPDVILQLLLVFLVVGKKKQQNYHQSIQFNFHSVLLLNAMLSTNLPCRLS